MTIGEWWKAIMEKYPSFEWDFGLRGDWHDDGWYKDVRKAAIRDRQFMDRYVADEAESREETLNETLDGLTGTLKESMLDGGELDSYADFLERKHAHEHHREVKRRMAWIRLYDDGGGYGSERQEWAWEDIDIEWCWECVQEDDPAYLLDRYEPERVRCSGGTEADVDDVYFVCPFCESAVVLKRELEDDDTYECGYCGSCQLIDPEDPAGSLARLAALVLWPFKRPTELKTAEEEYKERQRKEAA